MKKYAKLCVKIVQVKSIAQDHSLGTIFAFSSNSEKIRPFLATIELLKRCTVVYSMSLGQATVTGFWRRIGAGVDTGGLAYVTATADRHSTAG